VQKILYSEQNKIFLSVLHLTHHGVYLIVIVFATGSQSTVQPRDSATNLSGSIVLPFIMTGLTS